jgi:NAD(P)-dependent dehydrogenase (short-subunit alcohol dehydrogenase family)
VNEIAGRTVLIPGGTGHVGRAVTRRFLEAGAVVLVAARRPEALDELRASLGSLAKRLFTRPADVGDEAEVSRLMEEARARLGHVDALVHLVGGFAGGVPVAELPTRSWEEMLTLNLRSTFYCVRGVLPHMLERRFGKIVTVAARSGLKGTPRSAAYSAAKAGVIALTQAVADEVKDAGVNVNCVVPSTIDTPANRAAMPRADFTKWVKTEEVADVMLFLVSDAARAMHGAVVPVFARA